MEVGAAVSVTCVPSAAIVPAIIVAIFGSSVGCGTRESVQAVLTRASRTGKANSGIIFRIISTPRIQGSIA
jgi:hypothetical protein